MKRIFLFIFIFLAIPLGVKAEFPSMSFSIGSQYNYYVYIYVPGPSQRDYFTETITSDTLINGNHYFVFTRPDNINWGGMPHETGTIFFRRCDSTSFYSYNPGTGREDTLVNFNDPIGKMYATGYYITTFSTAYYGGELWPAVYLSTERVNQYTGYDVRYSKQLFRPYFTYTEGFRGYTVTLEGLKIDGATSIQPENVSSLKNISLKQNYPNPFNPTTNIEFSLPKASYTTLKIYDVIGREVKTLISERLTAGAHQYQWNAINMPSGMYFYRLQADSFTETKRLMILK